MLNQYLGQVREKEEETIRHASFNLKHDNNND